MDTEEYIPDARTVIPKLTVLWWTLTALLVAGMVVQATSGALTKGFITNPCLG